MKIALCFHGLIGSLGKGGNGKLLRLKDSFENINRFIIRANPNIDFDIFVHSQSKDNENEILNTLNPVDYLIEKQKKFIESKNHPEIKFFYRYLSFYKNIYKFKKYIDFKKIQSFRAYSRWYSAYKVNELKTKKEIKDNFKYDFIILLRLDVMFLKNINLSNLKYGNMYCANWNDGPTPENNYNKEISFNNYSISKKYGLLDFWFIGDSEIMDTFTKLYCCISNYKIDPHTSSKQHIERNKIDINYFLYRFVDFEMTRRLHKSSD